MQAAYRARPSGPRAAEDAVQLRRLGVGVLLAAADRRAAGAGAARTGTRTPAISSSVDRGRSGSRRCTSCRRCCRRSSTSRTWSGCTALRRVICSGEALPADAGGALLRSSAAPTLHNLYGPTEAAVDVTAWTCRPGDDGAASRSGGRSPTPRIYVLDPTAQPVPVGVPASCTSAASAGARLPRPAGADRRAVRAGSVRRGARRAAATAPATRALPAPTARSSTSAGSTIRSSSAASASSSARSRRRLARHPACARRWWSRADERGAEPRLVAYVVPAAEPAAGRRELRQFLRASLPDYMVPAAFVGAGRAAADRRTARSTGGRCRRRSAARRRRRRTCAPRTPVEEALADDLGGRAAASSGSASHDNFFELGGHSLLATRVDRRGCASAFGVELPLRGMFEAPTVAELARRVEAAAARPVGAERAAAAARSSGGGPAPLSFAQQRLWFLDQLEPGSAVYNMPLVLGLRGRLDVAALEREPRPRSRGGTRRCGRRSRRGTASPGAASRRASTWSVRVVDLSDLAADQRDAEARAARHRGGGPSRSTSPPGRCCARASAAARRRAAPRSWSRSTTSSSDGWSLDVFMRELAALYAAPSPGQAPPLPALPVQYARLRRLAARVAVGRGAGAAARVLARQLAGAPPALELPLDRAAALDPDVPRRRAACGGSIPPCARRSTRSAGARAPRSS